MKRIAFLILAFLPVVAHSTVTTQTFSVSYTCTGSTGPYAFNFPISDATAMTVAQNGVLLSSSSYTVTPLNNNFSNGGSVTLSTACTSGVLQLLKRQTPLTQTTVFTDNMPVPMKSFERSLDKLTEIAQEQYALDAPLYTLVPPNYVFSGPSSGSASIPTFRALTPSDIPILGTGCGISATCPISLGGTGATTPAGALQNLGGISSTATTQQTMAGPLNASVNGVLAVTAFGAKGDCTGSGSTASCTDNYAAIQAAIDSAYTSGASVYFPANPSSTTGQTVYYTSLPINPKGVSMSGPAGAGGPADWPTDGIPVAVRGAPGKDVFAVVDQGLGGPVPRTSFTVKDFGILVDDSVDASASYPTRRPGRSTMDITMTSGSAIATSAEETAMFQPGDVGQAVTVSGAGSAGATLSTTIASWQSATQVTLAATATTSVTSATMYISVMNLATTQNIGNCAFAYDDSIGAHESYALISKSDFSGLVINSISNGAGLANNTCGFFFQGNAAPYQARWEHNYVAGETFPFAFVPASSIAPNDALWTGLGDFNVFDHNWIGGTYEFLSYNGFFNSFHDVQLYGHYGPHILTSYGLEVGPQGWTINIPESEAPSQTCLAGDVAIRISGMAHVVEQLQIPYCSLRTAIQWDASNTAATLMLGSLGAVNITGSMNQLTFPANADGFTGSTITDTGVGNTFVTGGVANPYSGIQPARMQVAGGNSAGAGPATLSRPALAFSRTHDFVDKGDVSATYYNSEDLWFWPKEVGNAGGPQSNFSYIADSTSESGIALGISGSTTAYQPAESNGIPWIIGKQFPAGKMRVYVKAKGSTTISNWYFGVGANGNYLNLCSTGGTLTLTTAWSVYSCDIDATGLAGQSIEMILGPGGTSATAYVAWIAFRPWSLDSLTSALQIGSGTAMTANHGTGTSVQHSDGTGASGDYAKFAGDGSLTDGGLGTSEGTISAGPGLFGASNINTVIAGTKAIYAGHFQNLQVITSLGGTCTTPPHFNVFDGTTNTGTNVTATATTLTKGNATVQAQTLTFGAGDQIGIYISTAGSTCTTDSFVVSAQYSTP